MRKKMLCVWFVLVSIFVYAKDAKYIFYFIGDGMGAGQRQIAEEYKKEVLKKEGKLLMNSLPFSAITTTFSKDTLVTDSAASGTALATGHKTDNGIIAKTPEGKDLKTLLELAQEQGKLTGLVTTTRITHATPAVFASHNMSRDDENAIAEDYIDSNVTYFAGGGARHFLTKDQDNSSKRKDNRDLTEEFAKRGYQVFVGKEAGNTFRKWNPKQGDKVFAALKSSHMPYEIDRNDKDTPSLREMTSKGIQLLSKGKKGFFMMIEGGRIDHASHAHDAIGTIHDTLAFDEAIREAYQFYQKHPKDTLIVIAADHETGGMGLGFGNNYFLKLEELKNVKASIEDVLQKQYKGDREQYFRYIQENMGLSSLSAEEKASIVKAMDLEDKDSNAKEQFGGYSPTSIAVAHILSQRSGMMWTTYAHTGVQVPLAAVGLHAETFKGFQDNTDVAKLVAKAMGVTLP